MFSFQPTQVFSSRTFPIVFQCSNSVGSRTTLGVNTFTLGVSDFSPPDIITIAQTLSQDGVVRLPAPGATTPFVAAAINIGSSRQIIVRPEVSGVSLPLDLLVCESDASAACVTPPAPSVTVDFLANAVKTFSVSVSTDAGSAPIPFDPAVNRIQLNFLEGSVLRANSSVAVATNGAVAPPDDPDAEGGASPVVLALDNVNSNGFNATATPVRFVVAAGSLNTTSGTTEIFINDSPVDSADIAVTASSIVVSQPLADGPNIIRVTAQDISGDAVDQEFALWAGSNSLAVKVIDQNGDDVANARVQYRLNEDEDIFIQLLTDAEGMVSADNIPGRPINLYAYAPNLIDSASTSVQGSATSVVLTVRPVAPTSPVDNNDLQLGTTDGWIVSPGTTVVLHEGEADASLASGDADYDLIAYTNNSEQKATVVRSIEVPAGQSGNVSYNFRHRFITTEVPGGYCGTQFNDAFGVEVRVVLPGGQPLEPQRVVQSMNGLGCSAFDANGSTGWMDFQLSAAPGATLEVTGFVQNVGDAAFQSWLVVDGLGKPPLKVSALTLKEFLNNKLEHFSVATTLTPGVPNLGVKGLLRIERVDPKTTATASKIVLKIKQGDNEAEGQLTAAAVAALIGKPIPAGGVLEWNSSKDLLFTIPHAQFAGWDTSLTATVSLNVELTPSEGKKSDRDNSPKSVKVVTRTDNLKIGRYGTRDVTDIPATKEKNVGGDDWMKQKTVDFIESLDGEFADMTFNDSAKMHAGIFPPHTGQGHTHGTAVDMKFPDFPVQKYAREKNAGHAARIIALVSAHGSKLGTILTSFPTTNGSNKCVDDKGQSVIDLNSEFYLALANATPSLANAQNTGRVKCFADHGHIHVEVINVAAPSSTQEYKVAVRKLQIIANSRRH